MTFVRTTAFALILIGTSAAQAQVTGATVTLARDTTAVGATKPPSRDASPTSRLSPNRRSQNELNQDKIARGICIGCGAK
ncbi:hypothetical protein MKK75_02940 [Methylobacterium sp. J-030]|uniref:hypothetical protein n=1 Tax=Methylobacterium sp. J-030 TaxID=2836627 RepID=UPI001FB8D659|nr:hypothetical protein [Methylobacterium sp. J-030]MCJ2067771.1 hypothetical protein [Methylobacterium sp. J-030]